MARIQFTDATGFVEFDNGLTLIAGGVGSRFAGWTPFQRAVGAAATSLGTGARAMFRFRTDFGASFSVPEIPASRLPTALRLQAHLEAGGTVRVLTEDTAGRIYASCCLAPDAEVALEFSDRTALLYTLSMTLINLGGTPMLCDYTPGLPTLPVLFQWQVSDNVAGATFARTGTATFQSRNA